MPPTVNRGGRKSPRGWGPFWVVLTRRKGFVPVSVFEYAAKSSNVPLCRGEDPFWDPDVAEVFIVLDYWKTCVVIALRKSEVSA